MKRVVIGLVGTISCGKDFLATFLEELGFVNLSLSDRVREEADRRGLARERATLQNVGNDLREVFGAQVLAERTATMIPDDVKLIVISGIRNPGEILFLKDTLGITIVGVDAPVELRLGWYLERARRRGEDGATEEDFWRANARDLGEGEDSNGQQGTMCLEIADHMIQNDGTGRFLLDSVEFLESGFGLDFEGRKKRGKEKA
ncbi:hypothetical protein A3A84_01000 [Candidatus Collierbacteria bacterium RIFCSPLOWO2_01_FULL_50_23]|uniref:Dephospho-CoA kinase n=1 Tax=Candidatus Collierbacteria bacterium RIFCSPHIGHO2_01_FULL_50_25 TaxID=1817722 RepID=A0A1F5EVE1_9BACT|nr:MAG: hypothetical protein A2703_03545 [Candidatus Collierbacteria bacterium RIFCSPHIGHO2_01_FULL_50_25]OGD74030.1 MAG: hypothetical protein A3A84_01000 [Candidatus Collierbacteria bacterium RIFCSPLOWO2_01_FULL_50_23]